MVVVGVASVVAGVDAGAVVGVDAGGVAVGKSLVVAPVDTPDD